MLFRSYGTAAQIGGFEGAFRGPRATVRGGVGVFQNTPGVQSIGSAMDNTGLPSAVQQIACTGVAVPSPSWGTYATNAGSIPAACADGSTGSVFANTAPNVNVFSPDYVSPRSVRGNLQWNGAVYREDWNDVQIAFFNPGLVGNLFYNTNGQNFVVKGIETSLILQPFAEIRRAHV